MIYDVVIIGAGPAGLSCAIEAVKNNLSYLLVDKGGLVDSIYRFSPDMTFFSTPDLLSIGDILFVSNSFRPSRIETLSYYRQVADHYNLNFKPYTKINSITKKESIFNLDGLTHLREPVKLQAAKVIIATGYYDNPNMLNIEGEELEKVSHYYHEAHPYVGSEVAIVGGKNSAVEAALAFSRAKVKVTLIYRHATLSSSVKYWIVPDIDKKIENNDIKTFFNTELTKINATSLELQNVKTKEQFSIKNDFLFALTGYRPDIKFIETAGADYDPKTLAPTLNKETLESSVKNLFFAGSIVAGLNNNKIFIENSRDHGKLILS
ncbi:MAG: YpdA family putative bacillithiol disulfide reductase [Nitrospinota bacterium]